jgi:Tripartite tricarboxylate transporter TctB family
MLTTDRVAGAALVVVALFVLWEIRRLPLGTVQNPGPAYVPLVLAVLLLVLGALLAGLRTRAERLRAVGWREARQASAILTTGAFAAWGLERIGYRLTIIVVLVFLLAAVERRGILLTAAVAVALASGSYFLFNTVLKVPLPRGPFGL